MKRQTILKVDQYYHVFNKSIAEFIIFNSDDEFQRMLQTIRYYQSAHQDCPLSHSLRSNQSPKTCTNSRSDASLVEIAAFCIMPTHVHFLLKQSLDSGISVFMGKVLNSYARYFNKKHKRKGPLWVGRFKAVHIETDEQLRHVSRYIHLNPTTANLVKKPDLWKYSSYIEAINKKENEPALTTGKKILNFTAEEYKNFVENQIFYQKDLAAIKHLIAD